MKIIRYQKSHTKMLVKEGAFSVLSLLGIFIVAVFILLFPLLDASTRSFKWAIVSVACIPFLLILRRIIYYNFSKLMRFAAGAEAEDAIVRALSNSLNDDYICIVNYIIPGSHIGDYDAIVLGPKGVILIETKAWKGELKVSGRNVLRNKNGIWRMYQENPFLQVEVEKKKLIRFLRIKKSNAIIIPIIAIFEGRIIQVDGYPGAFVTEYDNLARYIKQLPNKGYKAKELVKIFRKN